VADQHHLLEPQAVEQPGELVRPVHAEVIQRARQRYRAGATVALPAVGQHRRGAGLGQLRREVLPEIEAAEPFVQQDEHGAGRMRGARESIFEPGNAGLEELSVRHRMGARLTEGSKVNRFARCIRRPHSSRGF